MNEVVMEQERPQAVTAEILKIQRATEDGYLDLCELMHEAHLGGYYTAYGFGRIGDWAQAMLKISERQAFYYIGIWGKSLKLGLTKNDLRKAGVSSLKEIFSLDPAQYADEMRQLVAEAPGLTHDQVKAKVAALKSKDGEEPAVYMTLKFNASIKETVEQAFELARMNYGTVEQEGEAMEISNSKCLELICLSFVQDPNNNVAN